jgi:folate-binding protein YgfZ
MMSETVETVTAHKSPLDELHGKLHALPVERDGWLVPASYGDVQAEYQAVRDEQSAGLIDLSSRTRIEVSGAEAVQFLNGLVTNDVKALASDTWMKAAFPTPQGRLIASCRVLRRGDSFLFDTEAVSHSILFKTLARFTLAGDFRVTDRTHESAQLSLQGAGAGRLLGQLLGPQASGLERGRVLTIEWKGASLSVIRATHTAEDGFDLFVEGGEAAALWEELMAAGARPVGFDALEILRIEAGVPRYGPDMDETNIVTEAGLDDAVSYTKGCYTGQEIIARIHWRGHVAKRLSGLSFEDGKEVERGAKLLATDGREIGRVTSSTLSPRLGRTLALAYLKYDYLAPGTPTRVVTNESEREATVTELPFVRGSWYDEGAGREEDEEAGA